MKSMSSGSWAAYQECAERPDYDPCDDIPTRRTHCSCGAFLSIRPYFEGGWVMRSYPDFDPITETVTEHYAKEWAEAYWKCKKCGKEYDAGEIWS